MKHAAIFCAAEMDIDGDEPDAGAYQFGVAVSMQRHSISVLVF